LRGCSNPRCTRLFVDTSRAGNRRWCGMTECGNAAKVAAFRARQRA
jgi:predicted RNA-binding Zn ribbon-like protein